MKILILKKIIAYILIGYGITLIYGIKNKKLKIIIATLWLPMLPFALTGYMYIILEKIRQEMFK